MSTFEECPVDDCEKCIYYRKYTLNCDYLIIKKKERLLKRQKLIEYCENRKDCRITNDGKDKPCDYYDELTDDCCLFPPPCYWSEKSINIDKLPK